MKKIFLYIIIAIFTANFSIAQEKIAYELPKKQLYIGFDAMIATYYLAMNTTIYEQIRKDNAYEYNQISTGNYQTQFGFVLDYRLLRRLSITSGLKYNLVVFKLFNREPFLWFYENNSDITSAYLAKITKITETTHFITIPVGLKYIAHSKPNFGINLQMETLLNFRLGANYDVSFFDKKMKSEKEKITKNFGSPENNFYANLITSLQLRFGNENGLHVMLNIDFPSFILTTYQEVFNLCKFDNIDNEPNIGCRISFLYPINFKK